VAPRTIPVSEKFWLETNRNVEVLCHTPYQISSNPQVVSLLKLGAGSNLEFPLSRHHLCVCSRDLQVSEETRSVVSVHHSPPIAVVRPDRAVVGSLGAWEARGGPPQRLDSELVLDFEERVLLFYSEPRIFVGSSSEDLSSVMSKVGLLRLLILELRVRPDVGLAHHDHIVSPSERVPAVEHRLQEDLRVVSRCLVT